MNSRATVLSLYDYTGRMVAPWIENGYRAILVDARHPHGSRRDGRILKVGGDVRTYTPPIGMCIRIIFCFPPCTHLAASGARWWRSKGTEAVNEAISLIEGCLSTCSESSVPWFIENPVGRLSGLWMKPDYYFDPCDYAGYLDDPYEEAYTKRTCLWVGGGFIMPRYKRVDPVPMSRNPIHRASPGPDRGFIRSITPRGFAKAVFEANASRTIVVNRKQDSFDVMIDRSSKYGNPYRIGPDGDRDEVCDKYEAYLLGRIDLLRSLEELRGKRLGCWCKPLRCHGDILVRFLEEGIPWRRVPKKRILRRK